MNIVLESLNYTYEETYSTLCPTRKIFNYFAANCEMIYDIFLNADSLKYRTTSSFVENKKCADFIKKIERNVNFLYESREKDENMDFDQFLKNNAYWLLNLHIVSPIKMIELPKFLFLQIINLEDLEEINFNFDLPSSIIHVYVDCLKVNFLSRKDDRFLNLYNLESFSFSALSCDYGLCSFLNSKNLIYFRTNILVPILPDNENLEASFGSNNLVGMDFDGSVGSLELPPNFKCDKILGLKMLKKLTICNVRESEQLNLILPYVSELIISTNLTTWNKLNFGNLTKLEVANDAQLQLFFPMNKLNHLKHIIIYLTNLNNNFLYEFSSKTFPISLENFEVKITNNGTLPYPEIMCIEDFPNLTSLSIPFSPSYLVKNHKEVIFDLDKFTKLNLYAKTNNPSVKFTGKIDPKKHVIEFLG